MTTTPTPTHRAFGIAAPAPIITAEVHSPSRPVPELANNAAENPVAPNSIVCRDRSTEASDRPSFTASHLRPLPREQATREGYILADDEFVVAYEYTGLRYIAKILPRTVTLQRIVVQRVALFPIYTFANEDGVILGRPETRPASLAVTRRENLTPSARLALAGRS